MGHIIGEDVRERESVMIEPIEDESPPPIGVGTANRIGPQGLKPATIIPPNRDSSIILGLGERPIQPSLVLTPESLGDGQHVFDVS